MYLAQKGNIRFNIQDSDAVEYAKLGFEIIEVVEKTISLEELQKSADKLQKVITAEEDEIRSNEISDTEEDDHESQGSTEKIQNTGSNGEDATAV